MPSPPVPQVSIQSLTFTLLDFSLRTKTPPAISSETSPFSDNKVKKLIFLGSSCIYPKEAEQPIKEEALLSKTLENAGAGVVHHVQPAAVSITQATEVGTVYLPEEIGEIAKITHAHNYCSRFWKCYTHTIIHFGKNWDYFN